MCKIINYIGKEKGDVVYYLSLLFSTQGSVLVVDNSLKKDLFQFVSRYSGENSYDYKNITFVRDAYVTSETKQEFDTIIVYKGSVDSNDVEEDVEVDETEVFNLVMPDYTKRYLDIVANSNIDMSSENTLIIMRDYCTKKISDKGIAGLFNVSPRNILGHIEFTVEDEAAYISLSHNGKQSLKGMSDNMQTAITFIFRSITHLNEKQVKKIWKKACKIK